AAELGVLGLVYDAHAPAAQLLENAVVGDRLARHKGERPGAVILGRDRRASQPGGGSGGEREPSARDELDHLKVVILCGSQKEELVLRRGARHGHDIGILWTTDSRRQIARAEVKERQHGRTTAVWMRARRQVPEWAEES